MSEVARRMGMRPPSLYKHFASLHDVYDALFARGNERLRAFVDDAVGDQEPGLDRVLEQSRAIVRWSCQETGLAALMFWRPIPGFEPSPESFSAAVALVDRAREDIAAAVRRGELAPAADTPEGLRLLTAVSAGIASQQMSNQPGTAFGEGVFTSLLDDALAMWVRTYQAVPAAAGSRSGRRST